MPGWTHKYSRLVRSCLALEISTHLWASGDSRRAALTTIDRNTHDVGKERDGMNEEEGIDDEILRSRIVAKIGDAMRSREWGRA